MRYGNERSDETSSPRKVPQMKTIHIYILAIKYFLQGDTWEFAKEYAKAIVKGFK